MLDSGTPGMPKSFDFPDVFAKLGIALETREP
jgi:hypothetical protein